MKRILLLLATLFAMVLPEAAPAQVVTQLPVYLDGSTSAGTAAPYDFGNGPLEFKFVQGSGLLFTSSGSGIGSGTTTSITLTATPTSNPPCVGCTITGAGITGTTLVTAYNGTTGITVNTSQTIAASTPLAWGSACPATVVGVKGAFAQVGQPLGDLPFYTSARLCGYGGNGPGGLVLPFAIGAH